MAFGSSTISDFGGAASDLFASFGANEKAAGDEAEAAGYRQAAGLARQNVTLEQVSTNIQQLQQEREAAKVIGTQRAEVAGSGFEESGSALDLLRSSAQQGALAKALIGEQGQIQETAFEQQATSYDTMANAAEAAASAAKTSGIGALVAGGFKLAAGLFTLAP